MQSDDIFSFFYSQRTMQIANRTTLIENSNNRENKQSVGTTSNRVNAATFDFSGYRILLAEDNEFI